MAFIYISEYDEMQVINGRTVNAGKEPALAEQQVAIAAGQTVSAAFNARTRFVRINTDAACSILFSPTPAATPTADATKKRMSANATEFFGVNGGDKVATITNT